MSEVTTEVHDRALPFVGAVFDSIVDFYHQELIRHGCATPRLLNTNLREISLDEWDRFKAETKEAFAIKPHIFRSALISARDTIGEAVARSLRTLDPSSVQFDQAAEAVVRAGGSAAELLEINFAWREILRPGIRHERRGR